jgi:hypothetical protein
MAMQTSCAETSIFIAFLMMCAEKTLRLFRLIIVPILAWLKRLRRLCVLMAMSLNLLEKVGSDLPVFE